MSAPTAWAYQPPHCPADYPDQKYYRAGSGLRVVVDGATEDTPELIVFRFANSTSVKLTIEYQIAQLSAQIDAPNLRALHAALGDALQDIAAIEADRLLQESFDRISEELRDAEEIGGPRCYYAHPDIHYVPADQVAEKVRELEASGCKRYMVLAEPDDSSVVDASLEGAAA